MFKVDIAFDVAVCLYDHISTAASLDLHAVSASWRFF